MTLSTYLLRICSAASFLFLAACETTSAPVDISQSSYLVRTSVEQKQKPVLASVEIINDAISKKPVRLSASNGAYIPLGEPTSLTVASDLQTYFGRATSHGNESSQKVVARIETAQAYWNEPKSSGLPIVGLLTLGANHEFLLKVRVTFEVEENGKVLRAFSLNEEFSIPDGKMSSEASAISSYQRLIAHYREAMYAKLDRDFTTRYLN